MAGDGGERGKMGGLRNKEDLAYAALMVFVRALMLFLLEMGSVKSSEDHFLWRTENANGGWKSS